ncbi:MAG: hypothetical protein ACE3L7_05525 [Candidatus Pristimantibacillus sp.]
MMEDKPHWLLRMENGGLAEARTKAFLMDRFWILERSVDIQGADFIIQRRLTSQNILDVTPPRFGVIQVKFYQNTNTSHYLHEEYICDTDGQPRNEFFLVVHTGVGDHSECFLLSSKDILSGFSIVDSSKTQGNKYYLPGRHVLNNKYKITSFSRALDRIERALLLSNFQRNRSFMSWILQSFSEISIEHIENEYTLPLENWYADIPQGIFELKKNIEMITYDLNELNTSFNTVLNETDPLKILGILERVYSNFAQTFPLGDIYYDSELHNAVLYHKNIFDSLRTDGLLENFLDLQSALGDFICRDLALNIKPDSNFSYVINVSYNKSDLSNFSFHSKIVPFGDISEDKKRVMGFLSISPGNIEAYIIPGRLGFGTFKNGGYSEEDITDWHEAINNKLWLIRRPIMEKIYEVS